MKIHNKVFECPQCHEKGIGFWDKFWCDSGRPAKCRHCNALSFVHSKYRLGFESAWPFVASWLSIGIVAFLLFGQHPFLTLFICLSIWLTGKFFQLKIAPLTVTTEREASYKAKFGNWFIAGLVLIAIGVTAYVSL